MVDTQFLDSPVTNPDDDLLGMAAYASKLSEFINNIIPPFTIGIYGEWGSGKTSFVRLLELFLLKSSSSPGAQAIKFITFTAWPYKTADELWRAMILKIAQELFEVSTLKQPEVLASDPGITNFSSWLVQILTSDALVLRPAPSEPDPLSEYNELVAKLDNTLAGSISKSHERQVQLNQEETLLALVKIVTATLSSLSPLIAGLRNLLGLDAKIDPAKLLQREKNEVSRDRIESMQELRKLFSELFKKKATGKRVCIFLDDLDRCTPDVSLDLLEAIKIFLGEVPCIFIVAADEHLIGQGLRLRYKDLLDKGDPEQIQAFFAQKGQEYFEKIIQMGIRVPDQTPEQTHRFITAQYPEWMSATDIIETAIGSNPRRLKQYCNLLRYKYLVAQLEAAS